MSGIGIAWVIALSSVVPFLAIVIPSFVYTWVQRRRSHRHDVEHYNRWVAQMEMVRRRLEAGMES